MSAYRLTRRERRLEKERKALRLLIDAMKNGPGAIKTKEQALETGGLFIDEDGIPKVVKMVPRF